jgi:hypothetical protein
LPRTPAHSACLRHKRIGYRVYPGLNGKTKAGGAPPPGVVAVTISGEPVPARVGDAGNVVRGEEAER